MKGLRPEAELGAEFDAIDALLASRHGGATFEESYFLFGGRTVRIRIAGRRLAELITRPFAHLRCPQRPAGAIHLDITLQDERAASVPLPRRHPPVPDADGITEIAVTGRFLQQRLPHGTISLDRVTGRLVGTFTVPDHVDVYQRGKPLARLLTEWYADQDLGIVHAGLVARGAEGVLLAGKGGSGKSTSALASVRAGLGFLGEDYAALEFLERSSVVGHSVYNSVFFGPETRASFEELEPHLTESRNTAEPKSVVLVADVWPSQLRAAVPIGAVALCRVGESDTCRVRPATRAAALLALGPSSLLQIHGRRHDSLARMARLVEQVPCFHLELGRDLASVPLAINDILTMVRQA